LEGNHHAFFSQKIPAVRHKYCCAAGFVANCEKAYPTRPVRLIVPLSAASAADILARQLAMKMSGSGPVFHHDRLPPTVGVHQARLTGTAAVARTGGERAALFFGASGGNPVAIAARR